MGHFSGVNNAPDFEAGNYFPWENAVYKCKIDRVLIKETRKKKTALIVEMTVLESSSKDRPPGTTGTWFQDMGMDNALTNCKNFAYAVLGVDRDAEEKPDAEKALELAVNEGAMNGTEVMIETQAIITKEKKSQFTKLIFSPVAE